MDEADRKLIQLAFPPDQLPPRITNALPKGLNHVGDAWRAMKRSGAEAYPDFPSETTPVTQDNLNHMAAIAAGLLRDDINRIKTIAEQIESERDE